MKGVLGHVTIIGMLVCLSACAAPVGVSGMARLPKDAATTCASHCSDIGLSLDSVVVMANNVGCVCRRGPAGAVGTEGSSAGGMAALIVQEQQRQQQQQSTRR